MTNAIIIERLSRIKYLYQLGVEQSKQPERVAYSSILLFHDSIDMFMQLAGEVKNVKQSERHKLAMMQFFDKIPELTLQASVNKINDRRNSLKHNGQIPAKIDIEESRIISGLFFEQNTPIIFGFDFKDVNLFDLITYDNIRGLLKKAEKELKEGDKKTAVTTIAIAFYELLATDKKLLLNEKGYMFIHDYKIIRRPKKIAPAIREFKNRQAEIKAEEFDRYFEEVAQIHNYNIERIEDSMKILSLGINYRKYSQFRMLTPLVDKRDRDGTYLIQALHEELFTDENIQFVFDFVLECALKMQEFKYE